MNERIKELAKQAEDHADSQGFFVTINFASDYQDCLMEKFAELIVRECVAICQDIDGEEDAMARCGRQDCVAEIKEHFGVEE